MVHQRRIHYQAQNLFGWRYAIMIFGAVTWMLGVFMIWYSVFGLVKTAPLVCSPISTACPEFFYFGMFELALGAVIFFLSFGAALVAWLRGAKFSLPELIVLVSCLGLLARDCVSGALDSTNAFTVMFYPIFDALILKGSRMSALRFGSPNFNTGMIGFLLFVGLAFLVGLWGRIPATSKMARLAFFAVCAVLLETVRLRYCAMVLGFFSFPAILILGLAERDAAAEFWRQFKGPANSVRPKPMLNVASARRSTLQAP